MTGSRSGVAWQHGEFLYVVVVDSQVASQASSSRYGGSHRLISAFGQGVGGIGRTLDTRFDVSPKAPTLTIDADLDVGGSTYRRRRPRMTDHDTTTAPDAARTLRSGLAVRRRPPGLGVASRRPRDHLGSDLVLCTLLGCRCVLLRALVPQARVDALDGAAIDFGLTLR